MKSKKMKKLILIAILALGVNIATAQWQQTNDPDSRNINGSDMNAANILAGSSDACMFLATNNDNSQTTVKIEDPDTSIGLTVLSENTIFIGSPGDSVFLTTNNENIRLNLDREQKAKLTNKKTVECYPPTSYTYSRWWVELIIGILGIVILVSCDN
jgi:hypothetical protein